MNEAVPQLERLLAEIKITHKHQNERAVLTCSVCNARNYAFEGASLRPCFYPEARFGKFFLRLYPDIGCACGV